MNIISTIQQHYSKKFTLSVSAPIADVRKTFVAMVETGLHVNFATFKVQHNDSTFQLYGPLGAKAIPLVTTIYLETELDHNCTTLNITTKCGKSIIIANLVGSFIVFFLIVYTTLPNFQIKLDRLGILTLLFVDGIFAYYYLWLYFESSRKFLIEHFQLVQTWNGLGSHKPPINNPWIRSSNKQK